MTRDFQKFHNSLRIMYSLDLADLVEADVLPKHEDGSFNTLGVILSYEQFHQNPMGWLVQTASDEQVERLWNLIESRQPNNLKGEANVS